MWLLFGLGAIAFAFLNLLNFNKRKNSQKFAFISLSLTCLTLVAFYWDGAQRVVSEDWAGLMDTMPTMSKALLVCTLASILLNGLPLFRKENNKF
ncbi:MAG: hypothetical protein Q4E36_05990 [Bacillota bacterium]|nr:hypothetical protein [Bacillota bacterium]